MKDKKVVVYSDKVNPTFVKTVIVKYSFPKVDEFLKLLNSVDWKRDKKRVKEHKKYACFAIINCKYTQGAVFAPNENAKNFYYNNGY